VSDNEFLSDNDLLQESYARMADVMLSMEDEGWSLIGANNLGDDAFTLQNLHALSKKLVEKTDANPLLKRGLGLRTSYIFGRGVEFTNFSSKRVEDLISDVNNQNVLFSYDAYVINERSNFTSGQFFILGDLRSKKLQRIPFSEITGWVTDSDDAESLRFVRRSWSSMGLDGKATAMQVWYPVDTYVGNVNVGAIQGQMVDVSKVMIPFIVNKRVGTIWGIPDAFAAYPWAHAYNEYLKDGSRILKALSMFAWQLKSKTRTGATAAAASIAMPQASGSMAITGADMELSSLPRTSNSVDLGNGRPLAAMVASALEVSVVTLMSDPGTSGAYGVAETLDVPTLKAMQARQQMWESYFRRVFRFFGDKTTKVKWPKMESESSFRKLQSLALAKESGALWLDEYRMAVLDELDVVALRSETPDDGMAQADNSSAVPSQGNSGSVGSMQNNANDLRDQDNQATI
jgi:hypothetical protein